MAREPKLSRRTAWPRAENPLSEALARARAEGREVIDLTESNPTRAGFEQPAWAALLGDPRGARYRPEPSGAREAREAVAGYYRARGAAVDAEAIVLTASSSEAYSWLFKLLCDPGDAVLAPTPSYPLFPYLAELESVRLVSYPLLRHERWRIDRAALEQALDERSRAILAVHPANPTGSLVHPDDRAFLLELCASRGLALIVDEVFLDYVPGVPGGALSFAAEASALTFVLSGLSKVALLPQHKLGWIAASGPGAAEALGRLELIADSYLPVSTAVQLAAPAILAGVDRVQAEVRDRLAINARLLEMAIASQGPGCPVRRIPSDGGWYAVVEVPRTRSDEAWALLLLDEESIAVHPGYLFDMPVEGLLVVSLLPPPAVFAPAIERAVRRWSAA